MDVSVKDMKVEKLYPEIKEMGFDGIDVSFPTLDRLSDGFEDDFLKKCQAIKAAGLRVCQTHLTYYPAHLPPLGDYQAFESQILPHLLKEIELVALVGCPVAVIHLFFEESRENSRLGNLRLIEALLPALEKHGVVLAIENIYSIGCGEAHLTTAEDLMYYTDHFQSPYLGVCLDTGHAVSRNQDPLEMLARLGTRVKALHLHSNVSGRDLHLPPIMTGSLKWKKFYDTLVEIGYAGAFNMEIIAPRQMNLKTALAYYRMALCVAQGLIENDAESWTVG